MQYSEKVLDHARNPRHVGFIEDADGVGMVGDPSCGDFVVMTIRVQDGRIADIQYQIRGCGAAIATCSVTAELVYGQSLETADLLTDEDVVQALDGLPEPKLHCSNLAASALHAALEDYRQRRKADLHDWRSLYAR
ncbi:MAG: iron-sulfur cluster assembly scaffold protein [Chloroflexi bacterium]|nr:iron-sulfur cluster assembly scaffold protein [Chloroflexota bacterium]MBU1752096.1 iron-sulfur cluster assembly scaffold protein [Chloroflexota bacterium]MBU1880184.1 iron-sulfur cluster assembly scaffold protein [Chloroflexota bacterium]